MLVPDIADPGTVAVVGVEQASRLATASISDAYARHTPTLTFVPGFLFLLDGQHRVHLFNRSRLIPLYREAHRHRRDRRRGACMNE